MTEPVTSFDVVILGGGAAAYSAALYARRYNLSVGIVEKEFGGYTALAGVIENYPGVPNVEGYELMRSMKQQAVGDLGAVVIDGEADAVSRDGHCFSVSVGARTVQGATLILATGMEHRTLNLEREQDYQKRGVHYCATCDGPVYAGKRVAVVGGGDSAVKSANQLVDMGAEHVYIVAREDNVNRAEPINHDRLNERIEAGGVTMLYENEILEYRGGPPLEGVLLRGAHEGSEELAVSAVFIEIGSVPRTDLAKQLDVTLTKRGEIDVEAETMKTNIDGVFAAGDVCDAAWGFKQVVTSVAQGAIAATSAYSDISKHGKACAMHAMALPPNALPSVLP
jgi:thioredoxin reductase (NADPH)